MKPFSSLFRDIFSRSGGAVYHFRAFLYQKKLWKAHLAHVRSFLNDWNPQSRNLILVGPSGGYSLPSEFLARFESIEAYEPDALARTLFERRHASVLKNFRWKKERFEFTPIVLSEFKTNTAILFCNLLGQLDFNGGVRESAEGELEMSEELSHAQEILSKLADSHELASYHDILSGNHFRFEWSDPMDGNQPFREKFAVEAFDPYIVPTQANSTELNLHVHPAHYLFHEEKFRYHYWEWQITPTQTQIIEGVRGPTTCLDTPRNP